MWWPSCMEDEGRPLEAAASGVGSKPLQAAPVKAVVVNVAETAD